MSKKVITSEFVSWGHPDKIADQIADAILEKFLEKDKNVRTGIEVLVKDNIVVLGGEINSKSKIDYDATVREVFKNLPFPENHGLQPDNIKIINLIGKQSPEISQGVDPSEGVVNASDQGFMVGFASNETDEYMPLGIYLAKHICQYISKDSKMGLGPDTKTQVIVEYDERSFAPVVKSILVSTMQQGDLEYDRCYVENIIRYNDMNIDHDIFQKYFARKMPEIIMNPCGEWRIGGPVSDCGVTGRKLVVDAYGGYCNVGGGATSGKDLSKVDRSGAYMARYLAKNIVASGVADTCKVELSYMIGVAEPSSINIELGYLKPVKPSQDDIDMNVELIKKYIKENISLTPKAIIDRFSPCFSPYKTAVEGHYGNSDDCWEQIDFAEDLNTYIKNNTEIIFI
jgi:S-adenosylmethionine synthetase